MKRQEVVAGGVCPAGHRCYRRQNPPRPHRLSGEVDTEWAKLIRLNLTGIAAIIALVISLVKYVKQAVKEKNWPQVVKMVSDYMEQPDLE